MSAQPVYPPPFDPGLEQAAQLHAVEQATGLTAAALAARFESLGNDCEFGIFQRWCKAEVLGLFRFSSPQHHVVLAEIQSDFLNFGKGMTVQLDKQKPKREWIVVDLARGLREHTFIYEGQQQEEAIRKSCATRTAFLRRTMLENIWGANKIFVIKSGEGYLTREAVTAIARALRQRGPNWLLWVEPGTRVGEIEVLEEGLLRGTIDRLTVQGRGLKPSYAAWLAVITEAFLQVRRLQT